MGWLNNLFGPKRATITPDQLKAALKSSFEDGDIELFERICQPNQKVIRQLFPHWQMVPGHVQFDQEKHMTFLASLAQLFATKFKDDSLMRCLVGTARLNPLIKRQHDIQQAQEMIGRLEFKEARELLSSQLATDDDYYSAVSHALIGQCCFESGELDQAPRFFEVALELCRKNKDTEGTAVYLENLFEISRYLGKNDRASAYAQELSDVLSSTGNTTKSARFRKRAGIVRTGEPANRVVAWIEDKVLELDELDNVLPDDLQKVQFAFERNRVTLRPALQLTEQGKKYAHEGEYGAALGYFHQAASTDRFDPDCHYQEGFTLLKMQRYADAVNSLLKTEELAPGWYHCRADRWVAERLVSGELMREHFLGLVALEGYAMAPTEKLQLADSILQKVPHFAAVSVAKAKALGDLGRWPEAEAALRHGLASAEEADVRTRLLVDLGILVQDRTEKQDFLQQAIGLNGNLMSAACAKLALQQASANAKDAAQQELSPPK
jgi:tetratricopeptide (TPR) repeat protein